MPYFQLGQTSDPFQGLVFQSFPSSQGTSVSLTDFFRRFFFRSSYNPQCTEIANAFWDWVKRLADEIRRTSPYQVTDEQYWDLYFRSCEQFQQALRAVPHCGVKSAEERPCRGWWGVAPKRQPWAFPGSEAEIARALQDRASRQWPLPQTRPTFAEAQCELHPEGGYLCTQNVPGLSCIKSGIKWRCWDIPRSPEPMPTAQMNLTPFILAGIGLLILALATR
jgi:hypothetical protein